VIELCTDLQNAFQGRNVFEEILNLQGEVFRKHKNRETVRIIINGKKYFIKTHRKIGWREIIKNLFDLRLPVLGAENELKAIRMLEALGIETMKVAGFGVRGLPPAWLDSFLITEELTHTVSLENFSRGWTTHPPDVYLKWALIRNIASIAHRLHTHGINHRDFYICHFLLDIRTSDAKKDYEGMHLYLIDLHRVQMRKHTPKRWVIKDIAGLFFSSMDIGLTRRDLFRFMKAYTGKPLREALRDDQKFWELVSRRAITLYKRHFNRLPAMLL
jgi:heptose I phosphotransferase